SSSRAAIRPRNESVPGTGSALMVGSIRAAAEAEQVVAGVAGLAEDAAVAGEIVGLEIAGERSAARDGAAISAAGVLVAGVGPLLEVAAHVEEARETALAGGPVLDLLDVHRRGRGRID